MSILFHSFHHAPEGSYISVLAIISLILERHVSTYLNVHLEKKHKLLYQSQSSFRQTHSCQTALVNIFNDCISAINENESVGSLFLDLSKAFDLVDHNTLNQKLSLYG